VTQALAAVAASRAAPAAAGATRQAVLVQAAAVQTPAALALVASCVTLGST
jgi:hypothetical protein